ncbi:glycosyltransferase family 4 protein [Thiotrichales bacterium 19S9-12]|nr:glycosyltransferase family 4 protein [Thiotrichales bacterium 19S9-11]MCF6810965.1 glycosyltransferase family 4 protein [Thiotrichales bacterium 19S9-12]
MHILFISENYYPESNAGANRLYDHARIWVKSGYKVTILTCVPNFPKGKIFDGYQNKWRQVEEIDGVTVVRIKSFIAPNKGSLKRIMDFLSFGLHAMFQGLFIKNVDVIIGTSPQPFPIFAAWIIARLKRKAFIFEIRDLWPESIIAVDAMGKKNVFLKIFGWAIKKMYKKADVIVSVTDSFKQILIKEEKINPEKIIVCKNGIDFHQVRPSSDAYDLRQKYQLADKYVVGYVGTIGMAHSVHTILEAAKLNHNPSIHFVIMGAGAYADEIKQNAQLLNNVTFIDGGSRTQAVAVTSMLDACIVHLKDTPLFRTVIPSKVFEFMALGKPILVGVEGEAREIVIDQAKAGIVFTPEDAVSLDQAINQMRSHLVENDQIKTFVEKYFNREKIAIEMLEQIKKTIYKNRE